MVSVLLMLVLFALLLPAPAAAQGVEVSCMLGASGEACIFDLMATSDGVLAVDTRANSAGNRWRATIFQSGKKGGRSAVGTGSTQTFTGLIERAVKSGAKYELAITYEVPLPGVFPAGATVRVSGPVTLSPQRPVASFPSEGQSCQQVADSETMAPVDSETIACGALLLCRLDPTGDTDSFKFMAAGGAAVIKIAEVPISSPTRGVVWQLFAPLGGFLGQSAGEGFSDLIDPGQYTIQAHDAASATGDYAISLGGVSSAFQCGTGIDYGGPVQLGRLDNQADTDTFQFVAMAGDVVSISVTELPTPSPSRGVVWQLFSPDGDFLGSSAGVASVGPLPVSGTYTIVVHDNANMIGDYSLSLQKVGGM